MTKEQAQELRDHALRVINTLSKLAESLAPIAEGIGPLIGHPEAAVIGKAVEGIAGEIDDAIPDAVVSDNPDRGRNDE